MERPFPVNARLTAISLAFQNPDVALIHELVLPGTPVDASFKWMDYAAAQSYTVPDTKVGRTSVPNEVELMGTEQTSSVVDHGLDDYVPVSDVEQDNQGVDPLGRATNFTTGLVRLAREIRVANLVFNTNSYIAGQKSTLAGTNQWSDPANTNAADVISDALDVPLMRPNIAVFGQTAWTKTRRNPKIVQAVLGSTTGAGMVTRRQFAEYFELQDVFVGSGFFNTAKRGQTATYTRVWGKHASLIYRDRTAGPQTGVTFGFTGEFGKRFVMEGMDSKRGIKGSYQVRVAEQVREVICAPQCGYFFENAVA